MALRGAVKPPPAWPSLLARALPTPNVDGLEHRPLAAIRSGKYVRDYFYVLDAVEAYLVLAERMDSPDGVSGEAFNFSNEEPITVLDLVKKILERMGREKLKPEILGKASGEIVNQYLSSRKSRESLGWKAQFSLDRGLDQTIAWYRKFFADRGE